MRTRGHDGQDTLRRRMPPMRLDHILLFCSIVLVILGAYLSRRNEIDLRSSIREVERIKRVISDNEVLLSSLKDFENGQRGYLLTGDRTYLKPFEQAVHRLPERLENLRRDVIDASQKDRVRQLIRLISQKRAEIEATLLVRDQLGPDDALALVRTDK